MSEEFIGVESSFETLSNEGIVKGTINITSNLEGVAPGRFVGEKDSFFTDVLEWNPVLREVSPSEPFYPKDEHVYIVFDSEVEESDEEFEVEYEVLIDDEVKITDTDIFPGETSVVLNIDDLNPEGNELNIKLDGKENEEEFPYTIYRYDRDSFTFNNRFQYDKSYTFIDDVIIDIGQGVSLSSDKTTGEVILEIPTDGKYKIDNISVNTENEVSETKTHQETIISDELL